MPGLEVVFAMLLLVSAALPLGIALRLGQHRDPLTLAPLLVSQSRRLAPLFCVLLGTSLWVSVYALELLIQRYDVSVWLHRTAYIAIAGLPPVVLWMALQLGDKRPSPTRERWMWALLAPIPIATVILALTNSYQSFLWKPGPFLEVGALTPIDTIRGPWFQIHTAFSYACLAAAFGFLTRHYVNGRRSIRDGVVLLCGFLLPWVANFLHVFFEVGNAIDLTPIAFLATGLLLYQTVNRDLLHEVLPVARAMVLEMLGDAVFVLDEEGRILDANRSALDLMGELAGDTRKSIPAKSLSELWPELAAAIEREDTRSAQVSIHAAASGDTRSFDVRVNRLETAVGPRAVRAVALRDISARRETELELHRRAHFDGLTGLPNRDHFFDRMAGALRAAKEDGHPLAVLLLDLDRFKLVNDTKGHAAGDTLLRRVAGQLLSSLRDGDVVARLQKREHQPHVGRLGGDEFAIVLPRIQSAQDAGDVAMRLIRALERAMEDAGKGGGYTGASIGISVFPDDAQDADSLLKQADVALYQAKEWGGNRFEYSNARLARVAERRATIDRELRMASECEQLALVYQPKVRLQGEGFSGMEALLRWSHPELGAVSPAEFIPIAEKSGLIQELGEWVIQEACAQIRSWRDAGLVVPAVAVNVSGLQFAGADLVGTVTNALRKHDLVPRDLEIELTEHSLLTNDDHTFVALRDLRAIGVRIALDDFGTGYSALSCLNRFEIDTLKIDRSLLEGIDSNERAAGLISAVIALAHTLKMKVVAEGVEREEFADILRGFGCDEAQGFLYSRPLPPNELAKFLVSG